MDELCKSIPSYCGDEDYESWVAKVELILKASKVDDDVVCGIRVLPHLKGRAAKLFNNSKTISWEDIKKRLNEKFVDILNVSDVVSSLANLSLGEDVDDFLDKAASLGHQAKLPALDHP